MGMKWTTQNLCPLNLQIEIQNGGGDQISHYAELVFSKKLGPPSLISVNFRKLTEVLLNHVKYIEI